MDDDVVFFAMLQRYNIYFKYVSLRHDIWIVMVLSHPRRISTEPLKVGKSVNLNTKTQRKEVFYRYKDNKRLKSRHKALRTKNFVDFVSSFAALCIFLLRKMLCFFVSLC